jgi:hypothetical protein
VFGVTGIIGCPATPAEPLVVLPVPPLAAPPPPVVLDVPASLDAPATVIAPAEPPPVALPLPPLPVLPQATQHPTAKHANQAWLQSCLTEPSLLMCAPSPNHLERHTPPFQLRSCAIKRARISKLSASHQMQPKLRTPLHAGAQWLHVSISFNESS